MSSLALADASSVWLVRHGQSAANAGEATDEFHAIPLTALGREQAEVFARRFGELSASPPTLIVHSPYLRAKETAEPTMRRFLEAAVEVWPVQEFTYLDQSRVAKMTERERWPLDDRFWERHDPGYNDGPGAESFREFSVRVRAMLERLCNLSAGSRVVLFTHGYVMQAVRLLLLFPELSDHAMMRNIRILNDAEPIANTETLELRIVDGDVTLLGQEHITPLTFEGVTPHE